MLRTADYIANAVAKLPALPAGERDIVAVFPVVAEPSDPMAPAAVVVVVEHDGPAGTVRRADSVVYDTHTRDGAREVFRQGVPSVDDAIRFAMNFAGYEV